VGGVVSRSRPWQLKEHRNIPFLSIRRTNIYQQAQVERVFSFPSIACPNEVIGHNSKIQLSIHEYIKTKLRKTPQIA
jgi:hypothetical protein